MPALCLATMPGCSMPDCIMPGCILPVASCLAVPCHASCLAAACLNASLQLPSIAHTPRLPTIVPSLPHLAWLPRALHHSWLPAAMVVLPLHSDRWTTAQVCALCHLSKHHSCSGAFQLLPSHCHACLHPAWLPRALHPAWLPPAMVVLPSPRVGWTTAQVCTLCHWLLLCTTAVHVVSKLLPPAWLHPAWLPQAWWHPAWPRAWLPPFLCRWLSLCCHHWRVGIDLLQ